MRTALLPFVRTDDHGDEALGPHVPREGGADVGRGDALHRAREVREPGLRQAIEPDDRPLVEEFPVRVDPQREATGETRLRVGELALGRTGGEELANDRAYPGERGLGLVAARLQPDLERPGPGERDEVAVDAVRVSALVADVARET